MIEQKGIYDSTETKESLGEVHKSGTHALTPRSILIPVVVLIGLAYISALSITGIIPGLDSANSVPYLPAMAVLILLLAANVLIKRYVPSLAFKEHENAVIYSMISLGGMLMQGGLLLWLLFIIPGLPLSGIQQRGEYLAVSNSLSSITMPKSQATVLGFWYGAERLKLDSVPWNEWIIPLMFWTAFYGLIFFVLLCMATVIYRQWNTVEHLTFPVVLPIVAITKSEWDGGKSIWRNPLLWAGVLFSGILFSGLSHLHHYFPTVPKIGTIDLYSIFNNMSTTVKTAVIGDPHVLGSLHFLPVTVGMMYLVLTTEVLFSIWFMALLHIVSRFILVGMGVTPPAGDWRDTIASPIEISIGGFIGLGIYCLWISRHYLKSIVLAGLHRKKVDDKDEAISYKVAFWGMICGGILVVAVARIILKIQLWVAVYSLAVALIGCLSAMRIRAQSGVPLPRTLGITFQRDGIIRVFGTDAVSVHSRVGLGYLWPMFYGSFGITGAIALESFKMADETGLRKKSMVKALAVAFLVGVVAMAFFALPVIYKIGAGAASYVYGGWHGQVARNVVFGAGMVQDTVPANWVKLGFTVFGAVLALVTGYLRMLYMWWPLHPIGIALGTNEFVSSYWQSAFHVWFIKGLIMRYGGRSLWRKLQPFFIGLVIGVPLVDAIFGVIGIMVA